LGVEFLDELDDGVFVNVAKLLGVNFEALDVFSFDLVSNGLRHFLGKAFVVFWSGALIEEPEFEALAVDDLVDFVLNELFVHFDNGLGLILEVLAVILELGYLAV